MIQVLQLQFNSVKWQNYGQSACEGLSGNGRSPLGSQPIFSILTISFVVWAQIPMRKSRNIPLGG
jgi:hypothetical protein